MGHPCNKAFLLGPSLYKVIIEVPIKYCIHRPTISICLIMAISDQLHPYQAQFLNVGKVRLVTKTRTWVSCLNACNIRWVKNGSGGPAAVKSNPDTLALQSCWSYVLRNSLSKYLHTN